MSNKNEWSIDQFKAFCNTRKNPGKDINGKAEKFTAEDVKQKNGGNSCKDDLRGIIFSILKLTPQEEYRFASPRRFKFDYAFPDQMIAIEYEGINSQFSGHTTLVGYTINCQKYNLALKLGWKILRYTAKNYKEVLVDLPELLKSQTILK